MNSLDKNSSCENWASPAELRSECWDVPLPPALHQHKVVWLEALGPGLGSWDEARGQFLIPSTYMILPNHQPQQGSGLPRKVALPPQNAWQWLFYLGTKQAKQRAGTGKVPACTQVSFSSLRGWGSAVHSPFWPYKKAMVSIFCSGECLPWRAAVPYTMGTVLWQPRHRAGVPCGIWS